MRTALALLYVSLSLRETLFFFSEPFQNQGNLASGMEIRDLEAGTVRGRGFLAPVLGRLQVPEQTFLT